MRKLGGVAGGYDCCTRFLRLMLSASRVAYEARERLPALARAILPYLCCAGIDFNQATVDYSCGGMFMAAHSSRAGP